MSATAPILFTDTETTGLDPRLHHAWEIAVIRRDTTGLEDEYLWQVRPDLTNADPDALRIGRFEERFAVPDGWDAAQFDADGTLLMKLTLHEMLFDLQNVINCGGVMVGSNAPFDDTMIKKLLWAHERTTKWQYRAVDIATLAAGYRYGQAASGAYGGDFTFPTDYPAVPYKSYDLSRSVGVEPPAKDVAHTALGDARWHKAVYDAVTGGAA